MLRQLVLGSVVGMGLAVDICQIEDIALTDQEVWSIVAFSDFQIYFTLTVGIVSAILLTISILSWLCFPSFLLPSDIIFIVLCGTLLDNLTLIFQAVYSKVNEGKQMAPDGFGAYCNGVGFLNMLGNVVYLYYNAFFCGALAYTIHKTLKRALLSVKRQHLVCLFTTLVALLIVIFTTADEPFHHMCSYRLADDSSLGLFFLHILLTLFSFYSLRKFRRNIPQNTFFQRLSHFKYYYIYMVIFGLFEVVNCLIFLTGYLSCTTQNSNRNSILEVLKIIGNCMSILLAYASVGLRLGHPFILKKISSMRRHRQLSQSQHNNQMQQFTMMSSLVNSIKGSQVLSFIQGIMINYIEHIKKYPPSLSVYHFQRHYSFLIDENVTEDYIRRRITNRDSHFARQKKEGLTTLRYEVKIYTPEFYSWVFRGEKINLFSSFDLRKNIMLVKQESYIRGRKGQFFFCTFDSKFLLKTIQSQELNCILSKTQSFYNYFSQHPQTLIVKVLGLFKFERKDIEDETTNLMIMKNLTMNAKEHTIRTYDIKGMTSNRWIMKEKNIKGDQDGKLREVTLKDKDFQILEEKIWIERREAQKVKEVLKRDIHFLAEIGAIDYSLLVIKRGGEFTNQPGEYLSTEQEGVIYNIGLIDYLQEWSLSRKVARVFKTIITNEQMRANSPEAYGQRLLTFIGEIL